MSIKGIIVLAVVAVLAVGVYRAVQNDRSSAGNAGSEVADNAAPPGRNGYDLGEELFGGKTSLAGLMQRLGEIRECTHFTFPGGERAAAEVAPTLTGKFLQYQVGVKVLRVETVFLLLQGKRQEALAILADCERLGWLLANSNTLITRLIGVAVSYISSGGLEVYILNGCETFRDHEEVAKELNAIDPMAVPASVGIIQKSLNVRSPYLDEPVIRNNSAVAYFRLLRMANSAASCKVTRGGFPVASADFAPLLPGGLPLDPFADPAGSLRFVSDATTGDLLCYSIGPNEKDERGQLVYDPTNGTVSAGDIVVRVPQKRKFPFPTQGVRAATAQELRSQFPDGLPRDPFADTKGTPLGISDTQPVMVYSFGPDTNQAEAVKLGNAYAPRVAYDPTNGIVSPGDLFMTIPGQ